MKTLRIKLLSLLYPIFWISCSNAGIGEKNYPFELVMEEYLLPQKCSFTDLQPDSVYLINSLKEWEEHVICIENNSIPEINFSKKSLLIASGIPEYGIKNLSSQLWQISKDSCRLFLDADPDPINPTKSWFIAKQVKKLSSHTKISLIKNLAESYPIKLQFTDYNPDESSCIWKELEYDYPKFDNSKILIIDNSRILRDYIECSEDDYPTIDFDKNILLVAYGVANNGIRRIEKSLEQTAESVIKLNIDIECNQMEVMTQWLVAIKTKRFSADKKINLSTTIKY